jgi:two-component system chemotaxis sensor kinase CheA
MDLLDTSAFIGKFVEEARDRLKALTGALLLVEESPGSGDAVAEVLRQAHSLKGSARMLGLNDISQIAHRMEDLFITAKSDPQVLDARAFDLVFGAIDVLSVRVEQLVGGTSEPVDIAAFCQKLAGLLGPQEGQPLGVAAAPNGALVDAALVVPTAPVAGSLRSPLRQSLRVSVEKLDGLSHLAAEMVIQSLRASARQGELGRLENALSLLRDRVREARLAPVGATNGAGTQLGEYAETLDHLSRRLRQFLTSFSDDRVRLSLITEELRQNVIDLTMLPLSTVFDAFPRAVRDLARSFHKQVDLTIRGRETELDKKIIEQIADPLIHLVGNAVDHGIELPDERARQGKSAAGQLQISAQQQGNRIVIAVRDDGRGMAPAELRATALRRGIAPAGELDRWTDAEVLDLIFEPGFSTRSSTTDVSGRGVGMDVVKNLVVRLGGAVRVQSEPERGTTITLNLPLSLALLRVVLVETSDQLFALPTSAVRRILRVAPDEITRLQQGPVIEVAGEAVPLVALSVLVEGSTPPTGALHQLVLVAEAGEGRFGLMVEAVHEEQELVFEELRGPLRKQRIFAGAAIHGNGEIVPILDVEALFELAAQSPAAQAVTAPEPRAEVRPGRVLVVEDSLVAAELQKGILLAAGYEAAIAQDGVQALEMLLQTRCDLVIADVDMPRMDGFELTARLRADERFRHLPVIIVTARDASEDRRRGFEAGADAYVMKREFDQNQLLDTVRRLIGRGARPPVAEPRPPSGAGPTGYA